VLKAALQTIAERHGVQGEAAFDACMNNRALRERMADIYQTSEAYNVTGTPTFVIDGVVHEFARMNSADKVVAALDTALETAGVTPEPAESDEVTGE